MKSVKVTALKTSFDGLKHKQKVVAKKWIATGVMVVVLIVIALVKLSPTLSQFFAKWVSRPWRTAVGYVTSWFPFSIFEVLVIVAVIVGIVFVGCVIGAALKHKKFKVIQKLTSLVLVVASVVTVYTLTAGFDYGRPAPDKPWLDVPTLSIAEYKSIVFDYAKAAGELSKSFQKDQNGNTIFPYTFEEMAKVMQQEVQNYAGGDYGWYAPLPKKVLNSWWLDWTNILGIMFAPTNEVNMNGAIGDLFLPHYMAHEMAHALGIMNEREANIFAAYITLNSDNPYVRYSGYHYQLYSLYSVFAQLEHHMHGTTDPDGTVEETYCEEGKECPQYSPTIKEVDRLLGADFIKDYEMPYYSPVAPPIFRSVSQWLNDVYLKLSGLLEGTGNYNPGDYEILPPDPDNPDNPDEPIEPTIQYSETQKIFIYLHTKWFG